MSMRRKSTAERALHGARAMMYAALLTLAPALSAGAQAQGADPKLQFIEEPAPFVSTLMLHQVDGRPIVSAHGEDRVYRPWISPQQFDQLLSGLEARGYHVVSLDAALDVLLHHAPARSLPLKPLLLTFDDGFASAWTYATPILRKHHAVAAMFFEGIQTDTNPDRLTSPQLRAMAASGVWTLESHGFRGHSNVVLDAAGDENPYWYANAAWLPERHRRETYAEYETRMRDDFRRFRTTFEPLAGRPIDVFAYPSGEFGQNPPARRGTNPTLIDEDAGHSNVSGLTPYLFDALRKEGYRAAFAVSLTNVDRPASPLDDPLAIPRLGVGSDFQMAQLESLQLPGLELPAVAGDGAYADCGPLAVTQDRIWTASTNRPELFALNYDGRVVDRVRVDALMDDRKGQAALISGLIVHGSEFTIVQQAGTWPGAAPRLTRLRIEGSKVEIIERRALPEPLGWLVGIAEDGGKLFGLNDAGELYDIASGALVYTIPLPAGTDRQDRFTGPVMAAHRLLAYDTKERAFVTLGPDDRQTIPLAVSGGTPHDFATLGDALYVNAWSNDHHALAEFQVRGTLAPVAFRADAPSAEAPDVEDADRSPAASSLYASAERESRFGDTIATVDAYRPLGKKSSSALLRPYLGLYANNDSAAGAGVSQWRSDDYALGALGLAFTTPAGMRLFAQLGAALPTAPLNVGAASGDVRTGVTFSRDWTAVGGSQLPYLSVFGSTTYLSRYSNTFAYSEIEAGRRSVFGKSLIETFARNTISLDAHRISANNIDQASLGVRAYPLGVHGPALALEAVAGVHLRGARRSSRTGPRAGYFMIRPTLSFGGPW